MRSLLPIALLLATSGACKNSESAKPAPLSVRATVAPNAPPEEDETQQGAPIMDMVREKEKIAEANKPVVAETAAGSASDPKKKDDAKGDQQDNEWVPAEFKKGQARWKDCGVYVDGQPIGFLQWGELPIGLPVVWLKDKVSANKRPGTDDPDWRWAKQRVYRFTDYLKMMGVDIAQIKELHVYGPRLTNTLIVSGKDLLSPKANEFYFRFGSSVGGKPIPSTPGKFGNTSVPDKIASVMVYVNKKPPTIDPEDGPMLDGRKQPGVPYYGDPIRGGVRVYVDNKLGGIIKRQDLDAKIATKDADGVLHWKLGEVLSKLGVKTKGAVETWVVRDEKRAEKLSPQELDSLTFAANSQSKGGILLGDKKIRANVLALHSRPLKPDEIPVVTEDDQ